MVYNGFPNNLPTFPEHVIRTSKSTFGFSVTCSNVGIPATPNKANNGTEILIYIIFYNVRIQKVQKRYSLILKFMKKIVDNKYLQRLIEIKLILNVLSTYHRQRV